MDMGDAVLIDYIILGSVPPENVRTSSLTATSVTLS